MNQYHTLKAIEHSQTDAQHHAGRLESLEQRVGAIETDISELRCDVADMRCQMQHGFDELRRELVNARRTPQLQPQMPLGVHTVSVNPTPGL